MQLIMRNEVISQTTLMRFWLSVTASWSLVAISELKFLFPRFSLLKK